MIHASQPNQHPSYDPLLNAAEAASYLGLHPETLKKLARVRQIACVRHARKKGSQVRFRLSALNAWIKANEVKAIRRSEEGR